MAEFLGYVNRGKVLAVEEFMHDYYLHANKVKNFSAMLIAKCTLREERALKILGYLILHARQLDMVIDGLVN